MPSPIKTVALCSPTGNFGPQLLQTLISEGLTVTAIVRASSKVNFALDQKVTRVSDEYREEELVSAFQGHDAVVLSLSFEVLPHATKFAKASIAAGTRWLIASTYGPNLDASDYALFPASVPHRQAIEELRELQKGQETWTWTSVTCGPWPELSAAARAWKIDPQQKTAELVDGGKNVFSSSTRAQTALAVARVLKRQPTSMKNKTIHVASFEVDMSTWLDGYKQILSADGWDVTHVDTETVIQRSQDHLAAGRFVDGYVESALAVCTAPGFANHFSKFATLANDELGLPREDLVEVLKGGLSLPDPFKR